jgi:hypothetical protein
VLVVEQNFDIGGTAIHSGGNVSLGSGDPVQLRDLNGESDPDGFLTVQPLLPPEALTDNPDLNYRDMTDWSVVNPAAWFPYRYNDPVQQRARADNCAATRQLLLDNYVRFARIHGTHAGGGLSRARAAAVIFKLADATDMRAGTVTEEDAAFPFAERSSRFSPSDMNDESDRAGPGIVNNGSALTRPLEFSAKEKGVHFMLNRHMDQIIREQPFSGRVLGITAGYTPRHDPQTGERLVSYGEFVGGEWALGIINEQRQTVNIRARKAVIIGTGGNVGNPQFRGMFYPPGREPSHLPKAWALLGPGRAHDASGIIAGMKIGAKLGGLEQGSHDARGRRVRVEIGAASYEPMFPGHPAFPFRGSVGINIRQSGFEHVIVVNQVGRRFFNEINLVENTLSPEFPGGPGSGMPEWHEHIPGDWRNCRPERIREIFTHTSGFNAACAINEGSEPPDFLPGPIWAIFDQEAVERGGWPIRYPYVADNGYFFSADTVKELAGKVTGNPHQRFGLRYLQETVNRYNELADQGTDVDFEKPVLHSIRTPPFYAANVSILWNDSYGGLHINGRSQVEDMQGQAIPSLYAGGEASGGTEMHGLGRATVQGYIAADNAAGEVALAPLADSATVRRLA